MVRIERAKTQGVVRSFVRQEMADAADPTAVSSRVRDLHGDKWQAMSKNLRPQSFAGPPNICELAKTCPKLPGPKAHTFDVRSVPKLAPDPARSGGAY